MGFAFKPAGGKKYLTLRWSVIVIDSNQLERYIANKSLHTFFLWRFYVFWILPLKSLTTGCGWSPFLIGSVGIWWATIS